MVLLAKPEDLLDRLRVGFGGLLVRQARPVVQPLPLLLVEPSPPHVAALPTGAVVALPTGAVVARPAEAVVAAGSGDVATDFADVTQDSEFVFCSTFGPSWWRGNLSLIGRPNCQRPPSVLDLVETSRLEVGVRGTGCLAPHRARLGEAMHRHTGGSDRCRSRAMTVAVTPLDLVVRVRLLRSDLPCLPDFLTTLRREVVHRVRVRVLT